MAIIALLPEFHPVLGRLEIDEDLNWYSGEAKAGRWRVSIHCKPDRNGDFAKSEVRAVRFVRDSKVEVAAAECYLAGRLLGSANEEWAGTYQARLSVAEFIERVTLDSVTFDGDGAAEYAFADDDLFGGHWLLARMRPDGIFTDAEIAG